MCTFLLDGILRHCELFAALRYFFLSRTLLSWEGCIFVFFCWKIRGAPHGLLSKTSYFRYVLFEEEEEEKEARTSPLEIRLGVYAFRMYLERLVWFFEETPRIHMKYVRAYIHVVWLFKRELESSGNSLGYAAESRNRVFQHAKCVHCYAVTYMYNKTICVYMYISV